MGFLLCFQSGERTLGRVSYLMVEVNYFKALQLKGGSFGEAGEEKESQVGTIMFSSALVLARLYFQHCRFFMKRLNERCMIALKKQLKYVVKY